ncbi:hypothetical protein C4K04_0284 [Pseudomonas chlororaphis]|uniref:Uncharacterized protein n=1 Tax=Pseudomonas chlororaphis TaxID=587753 RepID=A0A3G7TH84_9PSED|nr:hypothetical protein C4K15_0272 [Pseudomonas chlororaphis subsp. aurantiaca]AZE45988.1 hypothetical protein C4K04_0284 [Pseudomonas chlororaphis]
MFDHEAARVVRGVRDYRQRYLSGQPSIAYAKRCLGQHN